tara:strand:+ start:137 stop:301 length:165 start_codon:yes stop_codon:yes gene_type:complete
MGFGGGGGSGGGVDAHWHNSQTDNGGPLQMKNNITTGTTVQFNGGAEIVAEALL